MHGGAGPAISSGMTRMLRYVALGDSTAVGVGAKADGGYPERLARRLKASGIPIGILNLGVSGATTRDVLRGQVERGAAKRPDLVTLGIGTNDAWRLVPEDDFARQVNAIADVLERSGSPVVAFNIADLGHAPAARIAQAWTGVTPEQITARIRSLNRVLDALADRPRFHVVDLFGASQRTLATRVDLFSPDGFHPSATGYAHWADLAWPTVEAIARAWSAAAPP